MIAAHGTQGFVPFGREYVLQHPGGVELQVKRGSAQHEYGHPLGKSFTDISLAVKEGEKKELWKFRTDIESDAGCEELYVRDNTVVWSRGNTNAARHIIKTFTVDSEVLQADWCSFILPTSGEARSNGTPIVDADAVIQKCVSVVESSTVNIFTERGEDYIITLPFQVINSWVIKNGLLFERIISHSEITSPRKNVPNQTTLFSMLHPLDEVAPVITRTVSGGSPKISYLTDTSQHIVFTSLSPSLALTYDTMVGVHSVWNVRRAKQEEIFSAVGLWDNMSYYQPGLGTPGLGTPGNVLNQSSSTNSRFISNLSSQSPSMSPMRSYSGHQLLSPATLSKSRSPGFHFLPPSSNRTQSPSAAIGNMFRIDTPCHQMRSPAALYRTPPGSHNVSLINESYSEWVEPLAPDVCLDHIWTETAPALRDGPLGQATRVFLSEDVCCQKYLCFLVPHRNQLRCVKLAESNDRSHLIFGSMTTIQAKDAIPIQDLSLMLIVDLYGHVIVYTGTTRINKLHIPELPMSTIPVSMTQSATPVGSPQGGLVTSSRPSSAVDPKFGEGSHMISPVQSEVDNSTHLDTSLTEEFSYQGKSFVRGLRDSVNRAFTVELVNGDMYRCVLPTYSVSPGIELCLKSLRQILPKDTAVQVLGKWYSTRNALGGIGTQSEWAVFIKSLLSMMGYDTSRLGLTSQGDLDTSMSPVMSSKRPRPSDQGSTEDWEYLLESSHHKYVCDRLESISGLETCEINPGLPPSNKLASINTNSLLFTHMPAVLFSLHLVYEELKLNILSLDESRELANLLYQLASDLQLTSYTDLYCRDLPHLFSAVDEITQIKEDHLKKMQYPNYLCSTPPSVCDWLYQSLRGVDCPPIPYIPDVCLQTKRIISVYSLLLNEDLTIPHAVEKSLKRIIPSGQRAPAVSTDVSLSRSYNIGHQTAVAERVVLYMTELGLTNQDLESMPVGVALPLREAMFVCRHNPPVDWPEKAHSLIGRQDFTMLASEGYLKTEKQDVKSNTPSATKTPKEDEDGFENMDQEVLRLRFSEDLRVQEVRRLLQSAKPAKITVTQRPEVSDHDFIEEQERHLYTICIRTMALSLGRGMFTMCSHLSLPTEALPIPKLCLTGRAPPRNTTVELTHIDTPTNMPVWPHFHNGVAAGLRIANSSQVNSPWIIYNKPKETDQSKGNELSNEHTYAGFLMALGLNGHLVNLDILNLHDSLAKGHEMTSIGLLVGLSAAKRGTMDNGVIRLLSVHLSTLLPPTSTELNVPHNVQVAAILSVGLIYQGTAHRHISEVLLSEIGRPPGPEMENCTDRESYSLAAGLALGLVMFGKGSESVGLSDLSMADQLCHFMMGGHKRPLTGSNKDRYKSPSYQIKEGDEVNVDVTSPGATLALGMVYFNTNNSAVAQWLSAPDTQFLLDHVRPDFLLLRALSKGLVLWDSIEPTFEWVQSHIPEIVRKYAFKESEMEEDSDLDIDFETMSQAYTNITAGACMAMALKFAGSCNMAAFTALKQCLSKALIVAQSPSLTDQAGKITVENCMVVIVLSAAMVMAGSGNLDLLRVCRMLRKRVGPQHGCSLYGSHMAVSMSVGLLFLGGGRYTLSTRPEAIGPMICSFFPKFPQHSNDNRYHLQAFRHLYVLAAEPRLILPKDVDSGFPCYVPLLVKFKDTEWYKDKSFQTRAPCLLPELHLLDEVEVLGPRYWPIVFRGEKSLATLRHVLETNGVLYVKQRAGHLSYSEDPKGYRSMLAKSLTNDQSCHGSVKPDMIKCFTSNESILTFTKYFTSTKNSKEENLVLQLCCVLYECVTQEKPEALGTHIAMNQAVHQSVSQPSSVLLWQIKLILSYNNSVFSKSIRGKSSSVSLIKEEFLYGLKSHLESLLDQWESERLDLLVRYLQGDVLKGHNCCHLSLFLLWFDIPQPEELRKIIITGSPTLPLLCHKLPNVPIETRLKILTAWQAAR